MSWTDMLNSAAQTIEDAGRNVWNWGAARVDDVEEIVDSINIGIPEPIRRVTEEAEDRVNDARDTIVDNTREIIDNSNRLLDEALGSLGDHWGNVIEGVVEALNTIEEGARTIINRGVETAKDFMDVGEDIVRSTASSGVSRIWSAYEQAKGDIEDLVATAIETAESTVIPLFGEIVGEGMELFTHFTNFEGFVGDLLDFLGERLRVALDFSPEEAKSMFERYQEGVNAFGAVVGESK